MLIHARNLPSVYYDNKIIGHSRNWPTEKWEECISYFDNKYKGGYFGSIGTKNGARHIKGTTDFRDEPLDRVCTYMRGARVVVGESSGPLHLAMLCGTPVVVITHNRKEKSLDGRTNRWRYEKMMNPFNVKCTIFDRDNWRPKVNIVYYEIEKYLNNNYEKLGYKP